jgi:hypothetical protein
MMFFPVVLKTQAYAGFSEGKRGIAPIVAERALTNCRQWI